MSKAREYNRGNWNEIDHPLYELQEVAGFEGGLKQAGYEKDAVQGREGAYEPSIELWREQY